MSTGSKAAGEQLILFADELKKSARSKITTQRTSPMTQKIKGKKNKQIFDVPEKNPEDAFIKCTRNLTKIHGPLPIEKQTPHVTISNACPTNERRFEHFHAISEWNGKYNSMISYNFMQLPRKTDIPGTVMPVNT